MAVAPARRNRAVPSAFASAGTGVLGFVLALWAPVDCPAQLPRVAEPSFTGYETIGLAEGDDRSVFGRITDVFTDASGRIFFLDDWMSELRWYDAEGKLVGRTGRRGEGPGEFMSPVALGHRSGGYLDVLDPGNARISRYRLSHGGASYVGATRLGFHAADFCHLGDRTFLLSVAQAPILREIDGEGAEVSSFGDPVRASYRLGPEMVGRTPVELVEGEIACDREWGVFYLSQVAGELRRYSADGALRWAVELPEFYPNRLSPIRSSGECCVWEPNPESGSTDFALSLTVSDDDAVWVGVYRFWPGPEPKVEYSNLVVAAEDGAFVRRDPSPMLVTAFLSGEPVGFRQHPVPRVVYR